jgi:cytochrome b561
MKRYHPISSLIHLVSLVVIVMAWTLSQFVLEHKPNSDLGKIDAFRMQMTAGLIAGALLILRLTTKLLIEQSPPCGSVHALLAWRELNDTAHPYDTQSYKHTSICISGSD